MRILIVTLVVAYLFGCAAPQTKQVAVSEDAKATEAEIQKRLVIENQLKIRVRALRVGQPILIAGLDQCEDRVGPISGLIPASWKGMSAEYQDAFKDLYGHEDEMKLFVVPGSAAEEAGFKNKDSVLALNDISVKTGNDGLKKAIQDYSKAAADGGEVEFTIRRDGKRDFIKLNAPMGCAYPISVSEDDSLNAWADGKQIVLTKGMMRFTENDDELALIIGHELAHNNMGHIGSKKTNFWLGTILDVLVAGTTGVDTSNAFGKMAANAYSQEFESEADYVGLYFAARAGYETEDAANFWRRMAVEHPESIKDSYGSTHPSSPHRFVALEETHKEIANKQAAGEPLHFNMKERTVVEHQNSGQP